MTWQEFAERFPKEIGRAGMRELDQHHIFHTNDQGEVGVWITDTRTTVGRGEQLHGDDAECCLSWCSRINQVQGERGR